MKHTIVLLLVLTAPAAAATYHVDSETGNDSGAGRSPATAWKSLERVNGMVFQPGDKILFKAGTRYTGRLAPRGSGKLAGGKPLPITIAAYGQGARPRIDGKGLHLDAVLLRNIEYWEVRDLEVTNLGARRKPWQTGVRIVSDGFGKMRHIHLSGLHVHDVNGDLRKPREGCGIFFESLGGRQSHFDDLLIEKCHVVRTDRNGICQRRSRGAGRSLNVVIRNNLLEDIGGDGIKTWGSNGALIEHNILRGGRMRCKDAAAGIWPWDCDGTVIQFNEVCGMKGTIDGQGFDSDYLCRNTLFQYNYSHDNDGGFMLVCTPGNSYCEGTVIRYNISQNDGIHSGSVFHFGGGVKNTQVYNNTIYIDPRQDVPLLRFTEWKGGNARNTRFFNNIFYVDGRVSYRWGKSRDNLFENNIFFGNHAGMPHDPHAVTSKPPLVKPGSGKSGLESLDGYRMRDAGRALLGKTIPDNGGRDFFGQAVPPSAPPTLGASQSGHFPGTPQRRGEKAR